MSAPPLIKIWRFAAAPKELKSLFNAEGEPGWLALLPMSLRGTEVERFLQERPPALAAREPHQTPANEVVYRGGVLHDTQPR